MPGWYLNGSEFVEGERDLSPWESFWDHLGVVWVGFFKKYYIRTRRYDTLEHAKAGTGQSIVPKERKDHLFFFQTEMVVTLEKIDTDGNVPVDATIPFTARIIDPVLAEFLAGKWEEQATNAVTSAARNHIELQTYNELRLEKDADITSSALLKAILAVNSTLGLTKAFGVEIIQPRLHHFDPSPGSEEAAAALQMEAIAKPEQAAAIVNAETARIEAQGRADAIKKILEAQDSVPHGPTYAIADAIRESRPSTLVIGEGLLAIPPSPRSAS